MSMSKNHPFHMVTLSPWPIILSMNIMNFLMSMTILFVLKNKLMLFMSFISMMLPMIQWWRDVIRESTFQGYHSFIIMIMMKLSMIMFIISELFFFIAFFWTYMHNSMSPSIEIGMNWPPKSINQFNPYNIPLLNSIMLISSGFTITWSHHSMMNNNFKMTKNSLSMTIMLGIYFTMIQIYEYIDAPFCFNDSIYGSIFFLTTGFHGFHVNIGLIFLMICHMRLKKNHFSKMHHFNFEAASWYWHFVDIIWLLLYMMIYWWNY